MKTYELVVPCHFGMEAVTKRVDKVLNDREFREVIENSRRDNWLRIKTSVAVEKIIALLRSIQTENQSRIVSNQNP